MIEFIIIQTRAYSKRFKGIFFIFRIIFTPFYLDNARILDI